MKPILETTVDDVRGPPAFTVLGAVAAATAVIGPMLERGSGTILSTTGGAAINPYPLRAGVGIFGSPARSPTHACKYIAPTTSRRSCTRTQQRTGWPFAGRAFAEGQPVGHIPHSAVGCRTHLDTRGQGYDAAITASGKQAARHLGPPALTAPVHSIQTWAEATHLRTSPDRHAYGDRLPYFLVDRQLQLHRRVDAGD